MSAFLLTYLGTLIDDFLTFGGGGRRGQVDSATAAVPYSVQPYYTAFHTALPTP
jgi:hypothetical protein